MRVGAERRAALRDELERAGATPREAKGTSEEWRYELDGATVTLWSTGTVRVQGKGDGLAVLERLVAEVADPAPPSPADDLARDRPWIGSDESGKGDYFGPLVVAAAYVEPEAAAPLEALGVRDGKRLSDGRIAKLAPEVRKLVRPAVTTLEPERYNACYEQFRSEGRTLNHLLAWAHARSIEDLLDEGVNPAYAVVDQFSADARVVEDAMLRGATERSLKVIQFPRAEADIAVAAASILARDEFLRCLGPLPKGNSSPKVMEAARERWDRGGLDALREVAKVHFKTTARVLGGAEG